MTMSIDLLLQSLRLWNRAIDSLARLSIKPVQDDNPFDMSSLKQAILNLFQTWYLKPLFRLDDTSIV